MVDKEAQMEDRSEAYENLQHQLNTMLSALKLETTTVRDLERRLQAGRATSGAQNEEMKAELESIIGGLQQYLQVLSCSTLSRKLEMLYLFDKQLRFTYTLQYSYTLLYCTVLVFNYMTVQLPSTLPYMRIVREFTGIL